jgi:hypothetical protein
MYHASCCDGIPKIALTLLLAMGAEGALATNLGCAPKVLRPGDTLTIRLPLPHGGELGVWNPKGEFQFIAYRKDTDNAPLPPIDFDNFRKQTEVQLVIATAKGVPVRDGFEQPELLFSAPGRYHFLVSDNLETENPPGLLKCSVRYQRR